MNLLCLLFLLPSSQWSTFGSAQIVPVDDDDFSAGSGDNLRPFVPTSTTTTTMPSTASSLTTKTTTSTYTTTTTTQPPAPSSTRRISSTTERLSSRTTGVDSMFGGRSGGDLLGPVLSASRSATSSTYGEASGSGFGPAGDDEEMDADGTTGQHDEYDDNNYEGEDDEYYDEYYDDYEYGDEDYADEYSDEDETSETDPDGGSHRTHSHGDDRETDGVSRTNYPTSEQDGGTVTDVRRISQSSNQPAVVGVGDDDLTVITHDREPPSDHDHDDHEDEDDLDVDLDDPDAGLSGGSHDLDTERIDHHTSFFAQPGILAAVVGGAIVGLLCAILLVMLVVYRMRKKDEGSYVLDEPKRSLTGNGYSKNYNNKEFYA